MQSLRFHDDPRILHIDGDAFFASCEVARNPSLKGKPVVVGEDKGIATALTYEAKARGVTRGMPIFQIKKICPDVIIMPSDFALYKTMSKRMVRIVKRFSDCVEEYSVDECFADLSKRYIAPDGEPVDIARQVKAALEAELGMTFSVGLAHTKVLAKLASKFKKPAGFTVLCERDIVKALEQTPIGSVWGIGSKTTALLRGSGINTAADFVRQPFHWVEGNFTRPTCDIWNELQGQKIHRVGEGDKDPQQSLRRTRTFKPPTTSSAFLWSELSYNVEMACKALRKEGLVSRSCSIFLKTQTFFYQSVQIEHGVATDSPTEILAIIKPHFEKLYRQRVLYRATGITFWSLTDAQAVTPSLFVQDNVKDKKREIFHIIDKVSAKIGKDAVHVSSSLMSRKVGSGARKDKKRFPFPFLGFVS